MRKRLSLHRRQTRIQGREAADNRRIRHIFDGTDTVFHRRRRKGTTVVGLGRYSDIPMLVNHPTEDDYGQGEDDVQTDRNSRHIDKSILYDFENVCRLYRTTG